MITISYDIVWPVLDNFLPIGLDHYSQEQYCNVLSVWLAEHNGRWTAGAGPHTLNIVFDNDEDATVFKLKYGV